MYKQSFAIALGLLALATVNLDAFQLFENDTDVANIESKSVFGLDVIHEDFRGKHNTALNLTFGKQLIVHNIVEIIQTVHYACIHKSANFPNASVEVCRNQVQGMAGAGVNVILDVIELFDFLAFKANDASLEGKRAVNAGILQIKNILDN